MHSEIRLIANQKYSAKLFTKPGGAGPFQFGWVYIAGETGSARLRISDGATIPTPEQPIPVPGIVGSPLVTGTPPVEIEVEAGPSGFQGEITIEPTVV